MHSSLVRESAEGLNFDLNESYKRTTTFVESIAMKVEFLR
jgi:hypothetical protein